MFSATNKGASASAAAYSIIETAKAVGIDSYEYLKTILQEMPALDLAHNPELIDDYLPWSKKIKELCSK